MSPPASDLSPPRSALRRLAGLSPFGPIVGKELRTTARRRRSYVLRVFYLGTLLLVLLAAWSSTSYQRNYSGISARVQAQAELGMVFFICFTMFSVIAMAAIGPVLTCTAIGSERLAKTLPVLLMTPITAWQVVAGKLFSRLLVALTLIGLSLPVLALVRLLGGVELWQMIGVVAVCAATALTTAAIGLLFSTFMNRAYAVILLSYAAILLLYAFVPFILIEGFGLGRVLSMRFFACINPFACAAMLSEGRFFLYAGTAWTTCVGIHLALTSGLVMLSALVLRRAARRAGEQSTATPEAEATPTAPAQNGASAPNATAPARRSANRAARDVWDQPVTWREVRRPLMAKRWQSITAGVLVVALLLITYGVLASENDLTDSFTQKAFACIFNGVFWLLVAVLAATAIAQEKEADTWTLLLATPLSGHAIVWGKLTGLCRRAAGMIVLFTGHFLLFWVTDVIPFSGVLVALWVILTFNSVWVASGVYLSLRLRKITVAVIVNLLLAVGLYFGVFMVAVILGGLLGDNEFPELVGWYLPYYYLNVGLYEAGHIWRNNNIDMPGHVRVDRWTFHMIVAAVGMAHLVLSALILWLTANSFDQIVGRARQTEPLPDPPNRLAPFAAG